MERRLLNNEYNTKAAEPVNKGVTNCPEVLTGMSHEIRTNMNAIVAFSFLMNQKGYNEEEREEFSNQILNSCELIIGLFDNFLDSVFIDTGNSKAELRVCKLDNIFDDLLSEFREVLRRERFKDLVLVTENQFSNYAEVIFDTNRVTRVIRNLFQNALINTKSGYIKVGYYFRDEKVTFYILDSGQGFQKCKEFINTQDMSGSLLRFNDTCTAINISLAKKLIQLMDGSIWIESNGLTGAGIYFSVPAKAAASSELNDNEHANTMIAI
ncbi:MAG TPA: HAMP domain-containing sensor histidine kinase [Bacteroidales bacterium]|nr:HAMP domain-containing sensor histidine kinase [Bacteroidales bacterium]